LLLVSVKVKLVYCILFLQLSEDAARKENELNELEDEIERLRNRLQQPSEKYQDEVNTLSALAKLLERLEYRSLRNCPNCS
jgi:nitrate reductase assembly molybdenum cofactor insertion protein NarJ